MSRLTKRPETPTCRDTALSHRLAPCGIADGSTIGNNRYAMPTTIIVAQPIAARCA